MGDSLSHRGPDASGQWWDEAASIGFAHTRLAVIDLSQNGRQPMRSASGHTTVVFNGEIYNTDEIKQLLIDKGIRFRGHCDTEVLVESIEALGIDETLSRLNGMFAFASWDCRKRILHLVRDRFGIKPLYWSDENGILAFASELDSMIASGVIATDVNGRAMSSLLQYGYIPDPDSILSSVQKLKPGHYIELAEANGYATPHEKCYWSPIEIAHKSLKSPLENSDHELIDSIESKIMDATRIRMNADVPVGALLSGGIDSTIIAANMQEIHGGKAMTFTVGTKGRENDESNHARAVASHLGTEHHEIMVSELECIDAISSIANHSGEPFADSSQIPTFLISKFARKLVTVVLTGDGGDELFGGYNRYGRGLRAWRALNRVPRPLALIAEKITHSISPEKWSALDRGMLRMVKRQVPLEPRGDRLHKLMDQTRSRDEVDFYCRATRAWEKPSEIFETPPDESARELMENNISLGFAEAMMLADTCTYLPGDILTKVDRASMACSLEARVPMLDHNVFETAWRLPRRMKVSGKRQKVVLHHILGRKVPRSLFSRPKVGFTIPLDRWLRGPLREWADDLVNSDAVSEMGISKVAARKVWSEHLSGVRNNQSRIWPILMAAAWGRRLATLQSETPSIDP